MSRDYPDWINPFKAAQARREFVGTVRLAELEKVLDLIGDPGENEIGFRVAFGLDDQGEVRVEIRVSGSVPMTCQRTLRPFDQKIDSSSVVAIIDSESAAERLPKDYEPLLIRNARVQTVDLVAEELLLALPLVPTAPGTEAIEVHEDAVPKKGDRHRPFAALADLARKRN